jgi:hypothetical protein
VQPISRCASTIPFVPEDLAKSEDCGRLFANPSIDWWMTAITLAGKCCGTRSLANVGRVRYKTKRIATVLKEGLIDARIWDEFVAVFPGLEEARLSES